MTLCSSMPPAVHKLNSKNFNHALEMSGLNPVRLPSERFVRSASVENENPVSKSTRTYQRATSLYVKKKKLSANYFEKEFYFLAIKSNSKRYYSTKTPYSFPTTNDCPSRPPSDYKPIGVQLLARHGSRSLNSHDYDLQTLQVWQIAKDNRMLTALGKELKLDTELFMYANNHVGRGQLTELGRREHFELGQRLYQRLKSVFHTSKQISIVSSGKKRAMDSGEEFLQGLIESSCSMEISREHSNKHLLYFHKTCPNYLAFLKSNAPIKQILNTLHNCEQTRSYAQQVLRRIYESEFVDLLINDYHQFLFGEKHRHPEEKIPNEVAIVLCLYSMFAVSPAQDELYLSRMLAKYFTEEESNWFAYLNDAQQFYLKGPSIEGTTVTSDMAKPLFCDFFSSIDSHLQSKTNTSVHLRFAHAETLIPFVTLLQIPHYSNQTCPSNEIYTYENIRWRGDLIAPMAANIQWEIYQHVEDSNRILIRMLYNEVEVRFKETCQSITPNSFFYDYEEIKRAYADLCI